MHPDIPPGPHERLGYTLNFWQFVTAIDKEPAPEEIGATLYHCHQVLRAFKEPLPELGILLERWSCWKLPHRARCFPPPTSRCCETVCPPRSPCCDLSRCNRCTATPTAAT
jgi:hypothetical protein